MLCMKMSALGYLFDMHISLYYYFIVEPAGTACSVVATCNCKLNTGVAASCLRFVVHPVYQEGILVSIFIDFFFI